MEAKIESCWWKSLGKKDLLELAYILSKNAKVLWDNYHFPDEYKEKLNAIKLLPDIALEEIAYDLENKPDDFNKDRIKDIFTFFVTPVLQIRDGNLKLPFVVKSAFLSVFDILKGMQYNLNQSQAMQCFSSSISRSLDALNISNMMTNKEIDTLLQKFFSLAGK
jgi:hypothetical protein